MYFFFGKAATDICNSVKNRILSFLFCFTLLMSASAATAHKLETQLSFSATTSDSFHLVRESHYGQGAFFFRTTSLLIHLFIEVMHNTVATANGWQMLSQWTILWSALWGDGSQSKQCQEVKPRKSFKLMKANVWTEVNANNVYIICNLVVFKCSNQTDWQIASEGVQMWDSCIDTRRQAY